MVALCGSIAECLNRTARAKQVFTPKAGVFTILLPGEGSQCPLFSSGIFATIPALLFLVAVSFGSCSKLPAPEHARQGCSLRATGKKPLR